MLRPRILILFVAELSSRLSRYSAFLLSINDTPEIRDCFSGFQLDEVRLKYSVAKEGGTDARELIISNREVRTGLL